LWESLSNLTPTIYFYYNFLASSPRKLFSGEPLQYQQQIEMGRAWDTEEEAVLLYFASSGMPSDAVKPSTSNVVSTEQKGAVVTMLATREESVVEVSDVPKNRPLQQRADRGMAVYEGAEREKRLSKSYYD